MAIYDEEDNDDIEEDGQKRLKKLWRLYKLKLKEDDGLRQVIKGRDQVILVENILN